MNFKRLLCLFVLQVLLWPGVMNAQVTTSSITGTVTNNTKAPLSGATVTATHVPTGSVYKGVTTEKGTINIPNVRVGGPYRIEISYVGYQTNVIEDVYLDLGQPFLISSVLGTQQATLTDVVVTGGSRNLLRNSRNGANTTINRAQVEKLPSISRSVNDLTRFTPQANGTSIGGGNYRSNNFTVDGANFNNQFGIGQNIPAGGSPISLDAIEQLSVDISPFNVRQSGFTGAAINAVTRSGKNNFFGTAFYTTRNEQQQGARVNKTNITVNPLEVKQYAVSVGGPIIKNKLFFFVNLEQQKSTEPGPNKVASTPGQVFGATGTPTYVARPRASFLDSVSSYLRSTYNYETGPYQGYSYKSNNDKLFARIDWNISSNHKVNFRYSSVKSKSPSLVSSSTTGSNVSFAAANNRISNYALHFYNSNYFQEDNLYSWTGEYNGRIGKVYNNLRVSYANQNAPRSSPGAEFPLVDILQNIGTTLTTLTTFGYEPFTYGNLRDVKTTTINYDAGYTLGAHSFTAGGQFETSKTKNGFQRFGTGYYIFNSWADFVSGAKPFNYALTYPLTADGSQAFPSFKFNQLSLYLQDEYTVSNKLKLTLGLRAELPSYPDVAEIRTHPLIAAATFANGRVINTGNLPKTTVILGPRFGFNYDVKGNRDIVVRGGSGIFTGRVPFVWIVAQSTDAGLVQATAVYNSGDPNMPSFNPDPRANIPTTKPDPTTSIINSSITAMDENLKFPSVWKSSVGVDVKLPWNFVGTVDALYTRDINSVIATNDNLVNPTPLNVSGYADNRFIYPTGVNRYINKKNTSTNLFSPTGTGAFDAIVLQNVENSKAYYWSLTADLARPFRNGLFARVAYTLSGAKNYGDGSGDQALNLWSIPYQSSGNPNNPSLSNTDNVLPQRLVATLSYTGKWISKLNTTVTLSYIGAPQGRYSYYYTADFNRDNQVNDLIYVPRDASEITFVAIPAGTSGYTRAYTAQEQSDIFFSFVDNDPYLKDRKGQYAERNGATLPWRHQFDFRLAQQIMNLDFGKTNKHTIEAFVDIFNVGNLINSEWGIYKTPQNGILAPQNVSSLVAGGTVKPTFRVGSANGDIIRTSNRATENVSSTYFMNFGIRYNFN